MKISQVPCDSQHILEWDEIDSNLEKPFRLERKGAYSYLAPFTGLRTTVPKMLLITVSLCEVKDGDQSSITVGHTSHVRDVVCCVDRWKLNWMMGYTRAPLTIR